MKSVQSYSSHSEKVYAEVDANSAARSVIVASWRRSLLFHGLTPSQNNEMPVLTASELRYEQERNELLIHVAKPLMEQLFLVVAQTGCCVILTNQDSLILYQLIHDVDKDDLNRLSVLSGATWSEGNQGTNGVGTCIAEERPVLVHKDQHFRRGNIGLTCMGAPIFDADGKIMAVLDVSSARDDVDMGFAKVLTSLVTNTATRIETEYFRACFSGSQISVADGFSTYGTPLFASDQDDLVVGANRAARRMYGLQNETFLNPVPKEELIGETVQSSGLKDAERTALRREIARAKGNVTLASKNLGVSRATFYRLLRKHGLNT